MMNYMTRYDMNSNQKLERSKQAVPLRRTTSFLTANSHFAYGGLLRSLLITLLFLLTGVTGVWGQFTLTTDNTNPNYYLLQNMGTTSFYAMPYSDGTRISTTNVPNSDMRFYFVDAGVEDDIQYYYIIHCSGKYLYADGNANDNDKAILKTPSSTPPTENRYKFYVEYTTLSDGEGYYIINKQIGSTAPLCKRSGNIPITNGTFLKMNTYTPRDAYFLWNFVPISESNPLAWTVPFTLSTNVEKHYYRIKNTKNTSYYISINTSTNKVNTSSIASEDMFWYFEEVPTGSNGSDNYITYYYIINAKTGKYMCFDGDPANYTQNQDNAASIQAKSDANEQNCQFIVTRSSQRGVTTYYNIIPKALKSYIWNNQAIDQKNTNNGTNVRTSTDRKDDTNPARWEFIEVFQAAKPVIVYDAAQNAIKITTDTEGATIRYTTAADENALVEPTSTTGTSCNSGELLQDGVSNKYIKAIAVKSGYFTSEVSDLFSPVTLKCAKPIIKKNNDGTYTISCAVPSSGVTIYYTTDGSNPTTGSTSCATGYTTNFSVGTTVKAMAVATDYYNSDIVTKKILSGFPSGAGDGTAANPYEISTSDLFDVFVDEVNGDGQNGVYYKVTEDIDVSGCAEITTAFQGNLDGNYHKLSGFDHTMFNSINGGTVKNVMLKGVNISSSLESVGAIAGVAEGYSCIYNCGILPNDATFPEGIHPRVSTSGSYAGSIVGSLKDDSRVVNCFSYADVSSGSTAAGIVGYNTFASTAAVTNGKYDNLRTAVVNCMFYGDITGGSSVYPVYGGSKILNTGNNGINNYNYYREEASLTPTDYNCSWPASEENLTRFEYYRYLLNSNRELCGWWVGAPSAPREMSAADVQNIAKDASLMAKWVLDPSIAPYPILKTPGYYPSAINQVYQPIESSTILSVPMRFDSESKNWVARTRSTNTIETNAAPDIEGQTLGTISVEIQAGNHHTATAVTRTFTITAMDIDNNDFCYGKIQLPYYNDVFGNPEGATWSEKYGDNYTAMVVTGWDITTSEGTTGTFSDDPITGNNFADRNCTAKDTHRTFAQGGFYYVPYGVTSITITAHWADAYYLSNTEGNYDRVYFSENNANTKSSGHPFAPAGTRSFGSNDFGGQTINNGTISNVLTNVVKKSSVYDCAIVLVGNYQYRNNTEDIAESTRKPFTLMTVDLDFDNEPDYCFEWQFGGGDNGVTRAWINPVRFDFLPIVELGIAMKEDNSKYNFAIGKVTPYGHFETTETALIHMGQFEYADKNRDVIGPVILNNGTFDQICRGSESDTDQHVNYFILGGHVKMPSFTPGSHVKLAIKSLHCAVNVLGGEIPYFYLSGNYRDDPTNEGNPHCYIDGGKFDFVASGAKEQIVGDVFWKIDHAYIGEFYGGGINANKRVKGNIDITINRSKVTKFCGGPQFGDMESGKTVTTNATGTTFGVFYGAGNGGTCYSQYDQSDNTPGTPNSYNWESASYGKLANYTALKYRDKATGYHAKYELEMINSSAGTMNNAVCRTYMYAAQFATTNTGTISSTLTDCTVETNFFGGGLLGGVNGSVTSKLTGHTVVKGNAYGAGYGIANLTVDVLPKETGNTYTPPTRNENTSVITPATYPTATTYTWTNNNTFGNTTLSKTSPAILNPNGDGENFLFTEISLDNLGTVTGAVTLTITGSSVIGTTGDTTTGHVFGGGDESAVDGSTTVNISGTTQVLGNVFGGGNHGLVSGSATVNIRATEPANP